MIVIPPIISKHPGLNNYQSSIIANLPGMDGIEILGLIAGALTTIAFVPQVIKTWKSKSAKDISLNMFLLFCTGVTLWLIYGIIKADFPIIIANVMTLLLALCILYFKLRYK